MGTATTPSESQNPPPAPPVGDTPAKRGPDWPARVTAVRHGVEVVALVAAATYFGYQALDGWRRTNLDVTVRTQRAPASGAMNDHLAILVDLVKGANGSVRFGLAQARVACPTHPATAPVVVDLTGGQRLAVAAKTVQWSRYAALPYYIPPGERLQLAGMVAVPRTAACVVEVVVLAPDEFPGDNLYAHQWRATTVSLPPAAAAAGTGPLAGPAVPRATR